MRRSAIALLSVLAFALVGLFLPAAFVARASGTNCQILWNVPTGTFSVGQTVSASVSTQTCSGAGDWILTSQPSGTMVASGSFSCDSSGACTPNPFFSSNTLAKGAYQLTAMFNGEHFAFSFEVSQFFVIPEFPLAILGAVVPFAALGAYALRRRYTN